MNPPWSLLQGRHVAGHWYYGPIPLDWAGVVFDGMPGVYLIEGQTPIGPIWLDVGESDNIGQRMRGHDRRPDWLRWTSGHQIGVYAGAETGPFTRYVREQMTRGALHPVCGKR